MNKIWKWVGLAVAIAGVIGFRELPMWWHLIMWFPISFGYGLYYWRVIK